jgi:hypothetical protein
LIAGDTGDTLRSLLRQVAGSRLSGFRDCTMCGAVYGHSLRRLHGDSEDCSLATRAIFVDAPEESRAPLTRRSKALPNPRSVPVDRWLNAALAIRPTGITAQSSHGSVRAIERGTRGEEVLALQPLGIALETEAPPARTCMPKAGYASWPGCALPVVPTCPSNPSNLALPVLPTCISFRCRNK